MDLNDVLDVLAEWRGLTRELLVAMPGGGKVVTSRVPVDESGLVAELLQDDPG